MLGTIAGLWVTIIIMSFGSLAIIGAVVGIFSSKTEMSDNSILYLKLEGEIAECDQEQSFVDFVKDYKSKGLTLHHMLNAIRCAANDSKIQGIYIDAAGSSLGVASREELVEALSQFKESGKWIYAYADNFTQGDYLVASVAERIVLNPVGSVDIHGVGMQTPFFKKLLDKLGVKMQIVKVGTYKSAVEPYILETMSEPARRQSQVYVDSIWSFYANTIAENRDVTPGEVTSWADKLTFAWPVEETVDSGIVTAADYRRGVEQVLCELTDVEKAEDLKFVTPSEYLEANDNKFSNGSKEHIAVLFAVGDIVDSGDGGIVSESMVPQIIDLADDDNVMALVLRVNSGGGSAFASEQIWEALEYFKSTGKPFYVSMGDYAASGGYYISCGADRIFADKTTLTGSIGVFGMIPDLSGLVTDKIGVGFSTVASNPNATFMSLMSPMTDYQKAAMQRSVDEIYEKFTTRVAEGRNMSVDSVKNIAEGRVWIGSSAIELGLVDELGSLEAAIESIAEEVGVNANDRAYYPDVKNKFLEQLLEETSQLKAKGLIIDNEMIKYLLVARRLTEMAPIQARMPEITIR